MTFTLTKPADVPLADFETAVLASAGAILLKRMGRLSAPVLSRPDDVRDFLTYKIGTLPHEVFAALFLDSRHSLLAYEEMFRGTIAGASVHPREVVKAALQHNAAGVIFAHNHPSGNPTPSAADRAITQRLVAACALVDVRVLDHMVVSVGGIASFAEQGWL